MSVVSFSVLTAVLCFVSGARPWFIGGGQAGTPYLPTVDDWAAVRQIYISSENTNIEFLASYDGDVMIEPYHIDIRNSLEFKGEVLYITLSKDIKELTIRIPHEPHKYDVYIKAQAGRFDFRSFEMGIATIHTINASAYFYGMVCDSVTFLSVYSSLFIDNSDIYQIIAETQMGDIRVHADFNQSRLDARSGNIVLTPSAAFVRVDIKTISGDVNLNLSTKYGYYLDSKTSTGAPISGDFEFMPTDSLNVYKYGEAGITIIIDTISGSIRANKVKTSNETDTIDYNEITKNR